MVAFSDWRGDFGMSPTSRWIKGQTPGSNCSVSPVGTAPKYNSGFLFTSVKCLSGIAMVSSAVKAAGKLLSRSEGETIAMTVENNICFVIFTILDFVALLILLNDIVASPL